MKSRQISELKATLSECLAKVKAGEELIVNCHPSSGNCRDQKTAKVGRYRSYSQSGLRDDEVLGCFGGDPALLAGIADRLVEKAGGGG